MILVIILFMPQVNISVILMPFWIAFLWVGFKISRMKKTPNSTQASQDI